MRYRTSLRFRVSLAFALLGLAVSLGLAGILFLLALDMEKDLIAATLSAELEDYMARYALDPDAPPPDSTTLHTYVLRHGAEDGPAALRELEAGLHEVRLEGREYYAEVRSGGGRRFIALYAARQIRRREARFMRHLGGGVVVVMLSSAVLGFWLAKRVMSPVGELAARVAALRPEHRPAPLAGDFPRDEVGVLAREFDACVQRLADFCGREQAFTADVSHELRTPLAVIEGATEVLLDDPALDAARRSRVERIARSAREMSELATALLLLAREQTPEAGGSGCAVAGLVRQVVQAHRRFMGHKPVVLRLDIQADTVLPVGCTLLRVVLNNLVRNAIAHTAQGHVDICLHEAGIRVQDTGAGIPAEQLQRVFDRYHTGSTGGEGIGLSLVNRICRRYGWKIELESAEGRGTTVRLSF